MEGGVVAPLRVDPWVPSLVRDYSLRRCNKHEYGYSSIVLVGTDSTLIRTDARLVGWDV